MQFKVWFIDCALLREVSPFQKNVCLLTLLFYSRGRRDCKDTKKSAFFHASSSLSVNLLKIRSISCLCGSGFFRDGQRILFCVSFLSMFLWRVARLISQKYAYLCAAFGFSARGGISCAACYTIYYITRPILSQNQ